MYLLDTNICIALIQGDRRAINEFNSKMFDCYTCTIVLAELYKGVFSSQQWERNLITLNQFVRDILIIDFDQTAAEEFGKIQGELRRMARPTGDLDAMIGAIARSRPDILVTHNQRHFINISNLLLEDWLV